MLVILINTFSACGGGPGDPDGGNTPPVEVNVSSSLISVNPNSSIAAILANKSGAMVFLQETGTTAVVINRVVVVTNTGETTVVVRNAPAKLFSAKRATSERYFTVETGINEVADGVNRTIQEDLQASPLTRAVSGGLVKSLENEILNPESLTDRINRFATDTVLGCCTNLNGYVNGFLGAVGGDGDQIEDPDGNPSDPPLITGGQIDIVDNAGARTPTNDLARFTISPQQPVAPADLTASLIPGTPTSFNGTGLAYTWSYEKLPSDGFTPTVFGSGFSANLSLLEPGSYRIILNVRFNGGGGNVATASNSIEVLPAEIDGPGFTATTQSMSLPKIYILAATDPSGNATGFAWSSTSGQTAEGQETSLTFAEAGTFTITLTVTYPDGSTAQVSQTIIVTSGGGGGGGGGEVTPYIQAIFDHHAGTWTSNDVVIYMDGKRFAQGEEGGIFDGVNPLYDYVVTIDAATLTVTYSSPGGGGAYTFPGDILDYTEVFHSGVINEDYYRLTFRVDDDLSNGVFGSGFGLGESATRLYFERSYSPTQGAPANSFSISFLKPE